MKFTLKTKLTVSFILVATLTLALSSFLFYRFWLDYAVKSKKADLMRQGKILAETLAASRPEEGPQFTKRLMGYSSLIAGARVIITNSNGKIITDTGGTASGGGYSFKLPQRRLSQLEQRLGQGTGQVVGEKYLPKSDSSIAFVSVPINSGSNGHVILLSPVRDIKRAQGPAFELLFISSIISLIIASFTGLYLAFSLTQPLDKLKVAVRGMGRGQLLQKVPVGADNEIGELVSAFNAMSSKVDKAYSLQQDFASDVSHELKTPLTSIEGFSKVLLDGQVKDEEQQKKYLRIINTESRRISKIVNNLLALAQIDAGFFKPQVSEINVAAVLSNISEKFIPLTLDKNISLSIKPANIIFINDVAVVEQIIGNLVENAIKYTGKGGIVNISAEQSDSNVCFKVKDSGIGISSEDQNKIFNRFYRADKSDKSAGAGLGLSVCQALVKSLGGAIEVASTPGTGTEFGVCLPKNPQIVSNKP